MDFIDAFVSEFLKAMKADLKSNGRRLVSFTKKLDLILKLPEGYHSKDVTKWVNENSAKIIKGVDKLLVKYNLQNVGLGPGTVHKISAGAVSHEDCVKAKGKGALCIKGSVTAAIPLKALLWLRKSVTAAMIKAGKAGDSDRKKKLGDLMNQVGMSILPGAGGLKFDQVFKLIFLAVPDLANLGRRLETVESMKPEADIELDLFLTPPEGVDVDDLKKVAMAVKKEDLAESMNTQIKQICATCPDLEVLDLPEPKKWVECPIGQKCVQPGEESSAMQTGCWSMLVLLSMLLVDRQA